MVMRSPISNRSIDLAHVCAVKTMNEGWLVPRANDSILDDTALALGRKHRCRQERIYSSSTLTISRHISTNRPLYSGAVVVILYSWIPDH